MEHPNTVCQKMQEDFLKNCPNKDDREFHARLFRYGNAAYIYHQLAQSNENLQLYYEEWLQELPENIAADMKEKSFEACKTALPFTRYVNERIGIDMEEWMKKHLSEDDCNYYKNL